MGEVLKDFFQETFTMKIVFALLILSVLVNISFSRPRGRCQTISIDFGGRGVDVDVDTIFRIFQIQIFKISSNPINLSRLTFQDVTVTEDLEDLEEADIIASARQRF